MPTPNVFPCQLCGTFYPPAYLFDLKACPDVPGGCKVTCLKCWGRLEEREACASLIESVCPFSGDASDYVGQAAQQFAAAIRARK